MACLFSGDGVCSLHGNGAVVVWSADSSSSQPSHLQFRFRFLSESLDSYFQPLFTWDNLLCFPIVYSVGVCAASSS